MNIVLISKEEALQDKSYAEIRGERARHIIQIHKADIGKNLNTGLLNGNMGKSKVIEMDYNYVKLELGVFDIEPPKAITLNLIVSLPRPKTLKKVVHIATCMGVKKLYFIESWKVEKSYWKSPSLSNTEIERQCHLALEQSKDTVMPEIIFKRRFKPFAEDELPEIIRGTIPLVAHPYGAAPCPSKISSPVTLAIGPEGGFTDYEVETFRKLGFNLITLGERILRVEFAVCALISKLF